MTVANSVLGNRPTISHLFSAVCTQSSYCFHLAMRMSSVSYLRGFRDYGMPWDDSVQIMLRAQRSFRFFGSGASVWPSTFLRGCNGLKFAKCGATMLH